MARPGDVFHEGATPAHRCGCGKVSYPGPDSAHRALRNLQRRGRDRSFEGRLHVYVCERNHWHVGHTRREGDDWE